MAVFQKTVRRTDDIKKRPLSPDDVEFLAGLQKELNTQDTMCQRDPRFWVIKQTITVPAPLDDAEEIIAVDNESGDEYHTVQDVADFVACLQDDGIDADTVLACHDMASAVDAVNETPGLEGRLRTAGVEHQSVIVQDTFFLTHRDCEDHLRKYGYNYKSDAHAFAMTAVRSPAYEALLKLLQTIDWTGIKTNIPNPGENDPAFYLDMGSHPFTGVRRVAFVARVAAKPHLEKHFNGSHGYEQITHVTPGRTYAVHAVEGYGDVADFLFVDDDGNVARLASAFFETP